MMKVNLSSLMDAVASTDYDNAYCYSMEDGSIVSANDADDMKMYIPLPDAYEIDENQIMKEFIYELPEGTLQDTIYRSMKGRGMFGSFREAVIAYDMENSWFAFRNEAYERIALKWCEKNNIQPIR